VNFLEKKIEFDEKIRVFISSRCGEERYDNVRTKLKSLIENTGFAKVYLFESRRASTLSAQQDYLYGLDDSDVCLFLIDNADGVPEGVLKEYQRAKAHPKKSLFIFCNENKEEPTHIQKEITGAGGAKYYITKNFDEFIDIGYQSLINDIGEIYISYCKGRLIDPEFIAATGSIEEIDTVASESLDKQIFKNIDNTKKLISNEIFTRSDGKIENTCDLDMYSSEFLKVLFNRKNIKEYNTNLLFSALKEMQSENLHKVVIERWNAIQFYYMDDLKKAIEYEKHALNVARELQLPNWIVQDILIDLRNLYSFEAQSKNQYLINSEAQKELDSEKSALFYPLIDRYERSLYEEIINQSEKSSMRSPYSVTFGNSINKYGDYISNIYIMSVFNGSLTQLVRTTDRIKDLAFHLCHQYSDWEFRVLLLRMALIKGNKKEIKGITDLFNDVYGKMNGKDAKEIYEFVKGNPIKYQRNIAQLLAFQHLGYYFDDDYYIEVWEEISSIINHWIDSEDKLVALGDYIFDAIAENMLRLDVNNVVNSILIKVFDNEIKRFNDKALEVLSKLDFSTISDENVRRLISILTELIKDDSARENLHKLGNAVISLRKQTPDLCSALDDVVIELMPEFFQNRYSLETRKGTQAESKAHVNKFIDEINDRNDTQGKNGRYSGYMDNPYKTIENIIIADNVELESEMVSKIMQASVATLYAENQTLGAKVNAINLITFLRIVSDDSIFDYASLMDKLIKDEEYIFSGAENMFLDKTSKATLYFNFSMMKLVFNKIDVEEVLSLLSSYTDLEIFEKLEALKTIISIFESGKSELVDDKVLLLILQFTLGSTNDSNHDVRYYATKALLHFLSSDNKEPIMKKFLSIMDYDSVYIKSQIINYSEKLKNLDEESFAFIKEKALVDNHFVIRERALRL